MILAKMPNYPFLDNRTLLFGPMVDRFFSLSETKITERFVFFSLVFEVFEDLGEFRGDVVPVDPFLVDETDSVPQNVATQVHRIALLGLSNQADITVVRPGTSIGTASHADQKPLAREPEPLEFRFDLVHDARQRSLAFGNRKPTRWPCDTRD